MTLQALAVDAGPFIDFELPEALKASRPPERRGVAPDSVRLMVATAEGISHRAFNELASELDEGDLVVVNNSKTLPASVVVDETLVVHFSNRQPGGLVVVEPRLRNGHTSDRLSGGPPKSLELPGEAHLEFLAPFPFLSSSKRLWVASIMLDRSLNEYLTDFGRPIRYSYIDGAYPLGAYQTVFATVAGSAEMPSAGRPFTEKTLTSLVRQGIRVAPITLHTGVSSLESGEPPYPEWFHVSESTAALVNHTRFRGGKVVAVGTTVVRALESVADTFGQVHPSTSWTDLVIERDHEMVAVDALITGWHEPASTHLEMLESLAGRWLVESAYSEALRSEYLWHEFGDSLLLMSKRDRGFGLVR